MTITSQWAKKVHNAFSLWCRTISVRGMAKLVKGPRVLRYAWLIYLISMTSILVTATFMLIRDYLKFDFNVQTRILIDDPSPFPAFTVCHQHPFSAQAFRLWNSTNSSKILSPRDFAEYTSNLTLKYVRERNFSAAEFVGIKDSVRLYYQSLEVEEASILGHNHSIFLGCIRMAGNDLSYEQDCEQLRGYSVTPHLHPKYFNCHTFEPIDAESARETDLLGLIIHMGPEPEPDEYSMERAFLTSIFDQNEGLRVAVHEVGTYPELVEYGLNVEPQKFNEITYQAVRRQRLDVVNRKCYNAENMPMFSVFNTTYNYTQDLCLKLNVQQEIIEECQCIYSVYPSSNFPTKEIPYCERLYPEQYLEGWKLRQDCLRSKENSKTKRKFNIDCSPVCNQYEYPHSISSTRWHTHNWQLYWISEIRNILSKLSKTPDNVDITKELDYKRLLNFSDSNQNLTEIDSESSLFKLKDSDECSFVVLKRLTNSTTEKTDSLNLSLAILASRIGGLCSITIGLTAAVLIEILEFLYELSDKCRKNEEETLKKVSIKRKSVKINHSTPPQDLLKIGFWDLDQEIEESQCLSLLLNSHFKFYKNSSGSIILKRVNSESPNGSEFAVNYKQDLIPSIAVPTDDINHAKPQ